MRSALDDSLGGLFIGIIIAGILWGITTSQVFHYYTTRSGDTIAMRLLVAVVWASDTTLQMIIFVLLYDYCVSNFGNVLHILDVPTSTPAALGIIALQSVVVQCFYVSKIWKLSHRNKFLLVTILILVFAELTLALYLVYISTTAVGKTWLDALAYARASSVAFAGVSFVVDCVITVTISVILHYSKTGYAETNSMIRHLIIFFASTNLLTAVGQLVTFVVYLKYPTKFYVMPIAFVVTRLYANCFLATLNLRPYMRQEYCTAFESSEPMQVIIKHRSQTQDELGGVHIVQQTSTHYDPEAELRVVEKQDRLV